MKPILYRFSINGQRVNPNYKQDLSKEYEMESGQQFFRAKLSGKLSFLREDYDWLDAQDFSTEFVLLVEESLDGGKKWTEYYKGKFMKTDCTWDEDNKKCEVQPDIYDQYNDVIAGLDKEYNIIPLAPEMTSLTIMKRPLIQVYIPGDDVVSCFLGGTYWEQEVTESVNDLEDLRSKYYFAMASSLTEITVTGIDGAPSIYNGLYVGKNVDGDVSAGINTQGNYYCYGKDAYIHFEIWTGEAGGGRHYYFYEKSGGKLLYYAEDTHLGSNQLTVPNNNGEAAGSLSFDIHSYQVWMRYLLDVDTLSGLTTYDIPSEDILSDNRNYKKCIGYAFDLAQISNRVSEESTEYGLTSDGKYFAPPVSIYGSKFYPIARSSWVNASIWFAFSTMDWIVEESGRKAFVLKDAYKLSSVINVLLQQFSTVTHEATSECSQFLYGSSNPISYQRFTLLLTQKSNVLHGEYDQPAQKAETTLGTILNALRDIYRCYWYIEDGKLKIEHISFFRNGGTYGTTPGIGTDLTKLENVTNRKKWGYLTSTYEFDKADMPERYQFAWMDDVTEAFEGYPIEIRSKYVTAGKIEEINISSITTDVDYMLLNPSAISEDGFALFAAVLSGGKYQLPFVERNINGADLRLQNGYLTWITLQPNYYTYDLPAKDVTINGEEMRVSQTSRKKKQKLKFPSIEDIDTTKLIKTYLGNGQIEKITVNLSSRMNEVTLKYDTEQ